MVEFGPIQLIAIGFPDPRKLQGALLTEIFRLSEAGIIRVIGLLGIVKDENGTVGSVQTTELSDQDRVKLAASVGALIGYGAGGEKGAMTGAETGAQWAAQKEFGLTPDQIRGIAESVPPGSAAGFALVEHLWAKKLKEQALKQDGVLLANGFVSPMALVGLGTVLADGARAAEQLRGA